MLVYSSLRAEKRKGTDISKALSEIERLASVDREGYTTSLATLAKFSRDPEAFKGLRTIIEDSDGGKGPDTSSGISIHADINKAENEHDDGIEGRDGDEDDSTDPGRDYSKHSSKHSRKARDGVQGEDGSKDANEDIDWMEGYPCSPLLVMSSRLLYATANGRIGVGPKDLCIGDQVWIVPGSTIPFILRPVSGGRYRIVGETYVHGVMFSEAVPKGEFELTDIELV